MIEVRELTRNELNELIKEAPISETKFLFEYKERFKIEPYDLFAKYGLANKGIVSNSRPIYMSSVIRNKNGEYELWTVLNSNVNEVFSLSKHSKNTIIDLLEKFKTLYATMYKHNVKHMKWVEWLGFKMIREDNNIITYKLGV